jgi:hypothetical protein
MWTVSALKDLYIDALMSDIEKNVEDSVLPNISKKNGKKNSEVVRLIDEVNQEKDTTNFWLSLCWY